jgi:RNA polymerase sigma-70 factor, ECF subfamily
MVDSVVDSAEQFERYRPLMFSIAYRMLGSASEAEDIVQEAYLRYRKVPPETIGSPKAFLSTVVTRLSINYLELARTQREVYVGPWLPEPLPTESDKQFNLEDHPILQESISMAFLVLLEQLTPVERAVFLLREVFEYEYSEIAEIVGKEEAACRQLFSRGRKHISENRPRFKPSRQAHRKLMEHFIQATTIGDMDGLTAMLRDDVEVWADGGGKVRGAATRPLHGRNAVARFAMSVTRYLEGSESYAFEIMDLNNEPAAVLRMGETIVTVLFVEEEDGRIQTIRAIANPDKLQHLH